MEEKFGKSSWKEDKETEKVKNKYKYKLQPWERINKLSKIKR